MGKCATGEMILERQHRRTSLGRLQNCLLETKKKLLTASNLGYLQKCLWFMKIVNAKTDTAYDVTAEEWNLASHFAIRP